MVRTASRTPVTQNFGTFQAKNRLSPSGKCTPSPFLCRVLRTATASEGHEKALSSPMRPAAPRSCAPLPLSLAARAMRPGRSPLPRHR
ncbi:hypothetical protein AS9A_P10008 (plasmid) [Hoyosella subflava DQS3-9A1]|uniref:Uncharacterized protein n=1 Tax=Hoyosella subflava (strain DSM 45089 / JCM 17490 / NBRC 109087 / DQS3-9A1) TaxID=443218 RepID=F6ESA4_HOYSD|nr:hypothetical protein AS9A_P10008 [Hoyosella subflava DQS3-9A1]